MTIVFDTEHKNWDSSNYLQLTESLEQWGKDSANQLKTTRSRLVALTETPLLCSTANRAFSQLSCPGGAAFITTQFEPALAQATTNHYSSVSSDSSSPLPSGLATRKRLPSPEQPRHQPKPDKSRQEREHPHKPKPKPKPREPPDLTLPDKL